MGKYVIFVILFYACPFFLMAQVIDLDQRFKEDFGAQVKSIDEFIQRFNGNESHPELASSQNSRRKNIIALFDKSIPHENLSDEAFKNRLNDFARSAIDNQVYIDVANGGLIAEAKAAIQIEKRKSSVKLFLQMETLSSGIPRWAIVGVKGLPQTGIIDTTRVGIISPTEHEMHFLGLENNFSHNSEGTIGYRATGHNVDFVTAFLVYLQTGVIKFVQVEHLRMHCLNVPGYSFVIEEFGRGGSNSGWLISKIVEIPDNKKLEYLNNLIN